MKWQVLKSSNPNIKLLRFKATQGWLVRDESGRSLVHVIDHDFKWSLDLLRWEVIPNSGKDSKVYKAKLEFGWLIYQKFEIRKEISSGEAIKQHSSMLLFVQDLQLNWPP